MIIGDKNWLRDVMAAKKLTSLLVSEWVSQSDYDIRIKHALQLKSDTQQSLRKILEIFSTVTTDYVEIILLCYWLDIHCTTALVFNWATANYIFYSCQSHFTKSLNVSTAARNPALKVQLLPPPSTLHHLQQLEHNLSLLQPTHKLLAQLPLCHWPGGGHCAGRWSRNRFTRYLRKVFKSKITIMFIHFP